MGTGLLARNWSVAVGSWKFGIRELDASGLDKWLYPKHSTLVYLGPTYVTTDFTPYHVVGIGVIGVLLLVAAVALVISRVGRGKTA
jgi:hypothetical protein